MSDIASIGENEKNAVVQPQSQPQPQPQPSETEGTVETAAATTSASPSTETATQQQMVSDGGDVAAAGDAGTNAAEVSKLAESSPKTENKKTPVKRTPSKRMSFIERAQKESEELVKNMGGSLELEGGRRTRSSTRGTPTRAAVVSTPPPAKKARTSPATAEKEKSTSRGRGRGRKIDISETSAEEETKKEAVPEAPPKSVESTDESSATEKFEADETQSNVETTEPPEVTIEQPTVVASTSAPLPVPAEIEPSSDKPDASVESVPEKEQNNIDYVAVVSQKQEREKPAQADSPMETDESSDPVPVESVAEASVIVPENEKEAETPKATVASASIAVKTITPVAPEVLNTAINQTGAETPATPVASQLKEPTPEPMEVDSNSKNNDDIVEQKDNAASSSAEKTIISDNNTELPVAEVPPTGVAASEPESTEKIVDATKNSVVATNCNADIMSPVAQNLTGTSEAKVNESDAAKVVDKTVAINAVAEDADTATDTTEVKATSNDSSKPENDLCEPKIVSPSINATNSEGVVTTPQYCN